MRREIKIVGLVIGIIFTSTTAFSKSSVDKRFSVGTNLVEYLDLVTTNLEVGANLNRYWSIHLKGSYNPFWWFFKKDETTYPFQHCQLSGELITKYWPWYVYSGWHIKGGFKYLVYNKGGVFSPKTEEGIGFGAILGGGYALMLNKWWNIEFGVALFGGYKKYKEYSSPRCGKLLATKEHLFISPDGVSISFHFTF